MQSVNRFFEEYSGCISEIYFGEYQQDLCGNQNTFLIRGNAFWKKNLFKMTHMTHMTHMSQLNHKSELNPFLLYKDLKKEIVWIIIESILLPVLPFEKGQSYIMSWM